MKINVHSLLSIHSLLPCLRLLAPEMNFTLNAPPMGINKDSYIIIAITTKATQYSIVITCSNAFLVAITGNHVFEKKCWLFVLL